MIARRKHRLNRATVLRYDSRHEEGTTPSSLERALRQVGSADMEVNGPGAIQRSVPIGPQKTAGPVAKPKQSAPAPPTDAVEISSAGQLLDKLSKSPQVRAERLAQIKAAIDAGQYDTDEKLEAALMNLFQSMVNERDNN